MSPFSKKYTLLNLNRPGMKPIEVLAENKLSALARAGAENPEEKPYTRHGNIDYFKSDNGTWILFLEYVKANPARLPRTGYAMVTGLKTRSYRKGVLYIAGVRKTARGWRLQLTRQRAKAIPLSLLLLRTLTAKIRQLHPGSGIVWISGGKNPGPINYR